LLLNVVEYVVEISHHQASYWGPKKVYNCLWWSIKCAFFFHI